MKKWRICLVLALIGLVILGLIWRLVDLSIFNRTFLLKQSQARILRKVEIPAYRGIITDRFLQPVAISIPVDSVWVNPQVFDPTSSELQDLARLLETTPSKIQKQIKIKSDREFVYLRRRIPENTSHEIKALKIPGVFFQHEYKRFYPQAEHFAQVVGLANIDNRGQEGLELAYDHWLKGIPGLKEVLKDRLGNVVAEVRSLKKAEQGHDLVLSLDHRLQYLAHSVLKEAIQEHQASSGSVIILNPKTGEVMAVANLPTFDPNNLPTKRDESFRNRAFTDAFEPGSVIKPFNIAYALNEGKYTPETKIDTNPGWMEIGGYKIEDESNYGVINLSQVLQKSSNIGAAKIMLSLEPQKYWNLLSHFGFGQRSASGFPGESSGLLVSHSVWYPSVIATLAYGYGLSATAMQLAQAYAILATKGIHKPATFLKVESEPKGERIIDAKIAQNVLEMLERVVKDGGGGRAKVSGYRVGGKTGTAYIAQNKGYDRHKYTSSFVGIAPISDPQLVVAVMIHEPKGLHFGGQVAAPIFSKIMRGALHILDIPPDDGKTNQEIK